MVSTRLTLPDGPCGFATGSRRHRVDPMKLLMLIDRVKTAAGSVSAPKPHAKPQQVTKTG